jgi:hypothetical protein
MQPALGEQKYFNVPGNYSKIELLCSGFISTEREVGFEMVEEVVACRALCLGALIVRSEQDVLKPLGLFGPAGDFRKLVHLRPANAIESARGTAELWHWRSRTARIQDEGLRQPDGVDFPEIIKMVAGKAYQNGDIPKPVEDDFPAFDKPYAKLSQEEHSRATSIAAERHYALNWLCGYAGDWDETPAVFNI